MGAEREREMREMKRGIKNKRLEGSAEAERIRDRKRQRREHAAA